MRLLELTPLAVSVDGSPLWPGISAHTGADWLHGTAALARCRLDPQSVRTDVWEAPRLEGPPLPGKLRHPADLALAQLRACLPDPRRDGWAVAVPAQWEKSELRIFLGIAAELGMEVRWLFPRAAARAALRGNEVDRRSEWEWSWQSLRRVDLTPTSGEWRVTGCHPAAEGGILDFFRREARLIADRVLRSHRVDLLYSGETEQRLFDSWWRSRVGGEGAWTFQSGDAHFDFSEARTELESAHRRWADAAGLTPSPVSVTPAALCRLLGVPAPGAEPDLRLLLPPLEAEGGSGARWRAGMAPPPPAGAAAAAMATHVLVDGVAAPLPPGRRVGVGERVTMEDGREGVAIRLREN